MRFELTKGSGYPDLMYLGPVYATPFSNENSTKSCRFGLPFTLKRSHNRHQMKTILKTARFENGMKRFSVNA